MKFNQDDLIPAIIQDAETKTVLMMGYMNKEAFDKTVSTKLVTFYSRSKQRLWTKGESSSHHLQLVSWALDCDEDTILLQVNPKGPTCHTGSDTCWGDKNVQNELSFLSKLEKVIHDRKDNPTDQSYTSSLFGKGTNKIAQKVGEEAVELVIEAMSDNDQLFKEEASDLLFHYLVLLQDRGFLLKDVIALLQERHK